MKQLHSVAAAAEVYARRQGLSEETIGFAHQVKIEALARLGEIMEATPRATGGKRPKGSHGEKGRISGSYSDPLMKPATLAEQGVDKKTAHLARRLSALSDVDLNAVAARDKTLAAVTRETTARALDVRLALPDAKRPRGRRSGSVSMRRSLSCCGGSRLERARPRPTTPSNPSTAARRADPTFLGRSRGPSERSHESQAAALHALAQQEWTPIFVGPPYSLDGADLRVIGEPTLIQAAQALKFLPPCTGSRGRCSWTSSTNGH